MAVYVVNDFYTTPKRYEGLNGTSTVEEVAEDLTKYDPTSCGRTESGNTIYFEFPTNDEWLTDDALTAYQVERSSFIHFVVRGFEDMGFYGHGYDDQRIHFGYEHGVILGSHEGDNMDYGDAGDIAQILWEYVVREENR